MIVGSNQPYLFPYIGYWQLMNFADVYVISDSMQYIKKGYVNRNSILIDGKKHLFTLEALGVHGDTLINEVQVGNNRKKIARSIYNAYIKAPYFKEVYPMIKEVLFYEEKNLARYIGNSIQKIAAYLEMDTKFIYLSELQGETSLTAQERTIDINKRLNANHYVNAIGGQELYNKDDFLNENIKLSFLKTEDIEYKQFKNEFVPCLSIIDIMMFNSKEKIQEMLKAYTLV
ncbi:WbqC family protein [bacterium]|nr:WbqC family protein [bacterium]MBU1958895.1 WbqC family protein [bacterium]